MRLLMSIVYAYLLVAMSGFFDLTNAVVSCRDVISSQTTLRYNEALYNFKYFSGNGKTYAIAAPGYDYFAFSPGFNYETLYGGTDAVTLKYQLSTGKYGAARPVAVTSDSVKQFIIDNYGAYLGSDSTLVDAWKNYGAGEQFTAINGASLPYTSWSTPPDTSIASPSAVAMNGQGLWTPTTSGTYTKQIVEFDGRLDCAIDPSVPYVPPTPPPPTEEEINLGDLASYDGLVCMGDLNNDGELSGSFESAKCQTTPQGDFCPVGALDCDTTFQPPVCPAGSSLNTERDMCQADHLSVTCPDGYTWDSSIDKCVVAPTCPDGGAFNAATDRCEKVAGDVCPIGYTSDGSALCIKPVSCPTGTYNPVTDRCESMPVIGCPAGFVVNVTTGYCEAAPACASGWAYNTTRDRCEKAPDNCPSGYTYNAVLNDCVATPLCSDGGTLNGTSDKCELSASIQCDTGWSFNSTTGKCEQNPTCATPGTYNTTYNTCLAAITSPPCPTGYTYNSGLGVCTAAPFCAGGTYYNATTNRCEAAPTYSCPDSSYTYNTTRARCEKAPVCPSGMTYNATYNVCTQAMSSGCASGYTYVSARNRCERQPPDCSPGAIYNAATNKCDLQQYTLSQDIVRYLSWGTFTYSGSNNTIYGTTSQAGGFGNSGSIVLNGGTFSGVIKNPYNNPVFALWGWKNQLVGISSTAGSVKVFGDTEQSCSALGGNWRVAEECMEDCGRVGACGTSPTAEEMYSGACSDYYWPTGSGIIYQWCDSATTIKSAIWDSEGTNPAAISQEMCAQTEGGVYEARPYSFRVNDQATCLENGGVWGTTQVPLCDSIDWSDTGVCDGGYYLYPNGMYNTYTGCSITSGSLPYCWPTRPSGQEISRITLGPEGLSGTIVRDNMTLWGDGWYLRGVGGADTGYILFSPLTENPTCPSSGQLDGANDVCYVAYTPTCSQGTYDSTTGLCVIDPTCSNGALDGTVDVCYQASSGGCPTGYTLSGGICIKTPDCTTPGAFDSNIDSCKTTATFSCPTGYTYSASYGQCYLAADCNGGGLNVTSDKCEKSFAYTCPATYIPVGSVCQAAPFCYSPGTYSATDNLCDANAVVCSAGVLDVAVDMCQQAATCPTYGVLDAAADRCVAGRCDAGLACPAGFTLNGLYCLKDPTCEAGTIYNSTLDACVKPVDNCPAGMTWVAERRICEKTPTDCPAGTTFDVGVKRCTALPTCAEGTYDVAGDSCTLTTTYPAVCPDGYVWDGSRCVNGTLIEGLICPQGGGLDMEAGTCVNLSVTEVTCTAGTLYDEILNRCTGAPACTGATFDSVNGVCSTAITPCTTPFIYLEDEALCTTPPSCPSGATLDTSSDQCSIGGEDYCATIANLPAGCPDGYSLDEALGVCFSTPTCGSGIYDPQQGRCEIALVKDCSTYTYDSGTEKCVHAAQCPGPVDAGSLNYSTQLDVCVAGPNHACGPGLTWSTIPVNKCEAAPICAGAIYYDAMTDSCLASAGCPYGDQFTCMPNTDTGKFQCSPYECVNVAAGEGVELEPFSEDYLQDDGERDAEGNCLGQLYIFNGKPSRCRTPGWTVGYINNCCDSGDMMPEDMGSGVGMVAGAYGLYRGGAAAYQAYQGFDFGQQLLTLGADSAAVTQGATNYIAQSVSTGAVSPQAAQAFVDGANSAAAGATSASGTMLTSFARGVGAAVVTYAVGALAEEAGMGQDDVIGAQAAAMTAMIYAGMLSGPQAAFGIVVIVVMRLLMGTGCDVNDIMTSNDLKSKRCHYIGTYCEKKILSMCVQKAKGHCCFNSILARIIHQQGRPQLTSFQPAGAWGPAKRPNCRGFTPEEFQSLDFSKIDMSEYYQQVMVDIEERVQGASTRVESTIRGRFDQIQEGM